MRARDGDTLLQAFSKSKPFVITEASARKPMKVAPKTFATGLRPGGDYRGIMFGDDDLDCFRTNVVREVNWVQRKPLTFEPEDDAGSGVFVRWAKEGARYVVTEMGFYF
ncbi:MAG TPA: hypothetical protein VJU61_05695 [Polyangiaceae bacterium]|nr:hypothetical protein [Polyangiaceae bacterium]